MSRSAKVNASFAPPLLFSLVCFLSVNCSIAIMKYPPLMVKQPTANEEMLFQVASGQAENDKPFIIECEADGEPAPGYTWIKNGHPFDWQIYDERISQQPGRGTLVITKPSEEDLGQYQCFAENELGKATSNSVFVRMSVLNNFKEEDPITLSINEGQPISLPCQPPDGYPKPQVHWMIQDDKGGLFSINSTRKTADPEGSLHFSNVTREDRSNDFTYACSATSSFRNEYKVGSKVYLKVQELGSSAVQIKNEPKAQFRSRKNTVILKGRRLELWCIYSGTPLPLIKWTKEDGSLPLDRIEYDNYGKTMVIKFVDFEDQGTYGCEASNGVGTAKSYTMSVAVAAIPYFTVEPEIQNKAEDEIAIFRCEASGRPEPKIQWIFNGRPIEEAPIRANRKIGNTITIYNLTKSDTGNYGCNATNEYGYTYKDVYVNVLALAPEIRVSPGEVRTVDQKDVNMTCRVFGAPKPRVSWIRDGKELSGGRYNITDEGDLIIEQVAFPDRGQYMCTAINVLGSISVNGSLEVKRRTKITDRPEDYEVAAGNTATFRCNAVSDSSLEMTIDWLLKGKRIDFGQEPRFVKQTDNSLSITKTQELDSGEYMCRASTELDEVTANAKLRVQDVPNSPYLSKVTCNDKDASITWEPQGDNRAPILGYTIQHNTSFTPDTWKDSFDNFPASSTQVNVNMSPWSNYTFRVIAVNKIGPSLPSQHSKVCTTPEDVPYKNPDGVQGKGSAPNNLVIKWSPMPQIEHNGPGFKYRVYWRRDDIPDTRFETTEVVDWEHDFHLVKDQPTFKRYRLKVEAHNELGQAQVSAPEIIGFSGEDVPMDAPTNFSVIEIIDASTAHLSWFPVSNASIRGHFKGYKIQTWTEDEGEAKARGIIVENNNEPRAIIDSFVPNIMNYARVLVFNGAYDGPASQIEELDMPEGTPGPIDSLEAIPLGSSGFLLMWQKPKRPNGQLLGYHIYYQEVKGTQTGALSERIPEITDPKRTRAKLSQLRPGTKYRITVKARTKPGIGAEFYIERSTRSGGITAPSQPSFLWQHVSTKTGGPAIKVTWMPNESNPGSYFFVQYKRYGETFYIDSKAELSEDYIILDGLEPRMSYSVRVVAVDGDFNTPSNEEIVETFSTGVTGQVFKRPSDSFATKGWFIGMMLAIAFLLLILIIVCIVKRNRGRKYNVHEREAQHGRADCNEEGGGFPEFSEPLDGQKRDSLGSDVKPPVESDTDSMAEFADGDAGGMAEDGSFIGKYGKKQGETASSQAFATLV